jgi:hypothetical protein
VLPALRRKLKLNVPGQPFVRPLFVGSHQPRIARHVGGEDRGKPAGLAHCASPIAPGTARSFASVGELSDAIITFLADRNKNAKRYVWHAKGEDILRKIEAARQAMARNEASKC